MSATPIFKELPDGLLEYCGPTDNPSLVVEKWRELDASIDIGIWGQASIAAAIVPKYGLSQMAEGCGSAVTVMSRVSVSKPSISTRSVQVPTVASGSLKMPCSSVAVTSVLSPDDAVTVAPGTGSSPKMT